MQLWLNIRGVIRKHVKFHRWKICSAGGTHLLDQFLSQRCVLSVQHVDALFEPHWIRAPTLHLKQVERSSSDPLKIVKHMLERN